MSSHCGRRHCNQVGHRAIGACEDRDKNVEKYWTRAVICRRQRSIISTNSVTQASQSNNSNTWSTNIICRRKAAVVSRTVAEGSRFDCGQYGSFAVYLRFSAVLCVCIEPRLEPHKCERGSLWVLTLNVIGVHYFAFNVSCVCRFSLCWIAFKTSLANRSHFQQALCQAKYASIRVRWEWKMQER